MKDLLVIGNKNYSSWSLRPWLYMKVSGIPFEEKRIALYRPGSEDEIAGYSPAGRVPVLIHDGVRVWESLAILETLCELYPGAKGLPDTAADRAWARAICAEMHAGFAALRSHLPMNCRRRIDVGPLPDAVEEEVQRVRAIWRDCRKAHPGIGPFLFGAFGIADAMYAPAVCRFETYGIHVGPLEREYMDAMLALPALREWYDDARRESEVIEVFER